MKRKWTMREKYEAKVITDDEFIDFLIMEAVKYEEYGNLKKSLDAYSELQLLYENINGHDCSESRMICLKLAKINEKLGHRSLAESQYERLLAELETKFEDQVAGISSVKVRLASLYMDSGKFEKAKSILVDSLDKLNAHSPLDADGGFYDSTLDEIRRLYAVILLKSGDVKTALPVLDKSLKYWFSRCDDLLRGELHYEEVQNILGNLGRLADLYVLTGDICKLEEIHRDIKNKCSRLGFTVFDDVYVHNAMATSLARMGRLKEAKRRFELGISEMERIPGYDSEFFADALLGYIECLIHLNDFSQIDLQLAKTKGLTWNNKKLMQLRILECEYYRSIGRTHDVVKLSDIADTLNGFLLNFKRMEFEEIGTAINLLRISDFDRTQRIRYYEKLLPLIRDKFGVYNDLAAACMLNMSRALVASGEYSRAEELINEALKVLLKFKTPSILGVYSLYAELKFLTRKYDEAERLLLKSLNLYSKYSGYNTGYNCYDYLLYSKILKAADKKTSAIHFAKKAVNSAQTERKKVSVLGADVLVQYDKSLESVYKHLAGLLAEEGYLPESEHVLNLLKEKEYFIAVRSTLGDDMSAGTRLEFDETQNIIEVSLEAYLHTQTAVSDRIDRLWSLESRTDADLQELSKLEARSEEATVMYLTALAEIECRATASPGRLDDIHNANALMNTLREIGDGVVAIYTLSDQETFHTFLIGPNYRLHRSTPVQGSEFNAKVAEFRRLLQPGNDGLLYDPTPLAKELYDIILRPIEDELRNVTTVLWNLEGVLRYVPMAALHDGNGYLAQRLQSVSLTPSSLLVLKDRPKRKWQGFGVGVSLGGHGFRPLPAVRQELTSIIRGQEGDDGIMEGVRLLDEEATWENIRTSLAPRGFGAIHIASHFQLNSVQMPESYLLLGDSQKITLRELSFKNNLFGGAELLSLSACNTACTNPKATGKEMDSFAELAQQQGAKAVMASLWEVPDTSTALLMREFYLLRESGQTKAEALRQAQSRLSSGDIRPDSAAQPSRADGNRAYFFLHDEAKPYSHPYFWAPFILMGNYL